MKKMCRETIGTSANLDESFSIHELPSLVFRIPHEVWQVIFSFLVSLEYFIPLYTVCVSWNSKMIDQCVQSIGTSVIPDNIELGNFYFDLSV